MKTPFLFVTAAAILALTATSALADGPYSGDRAGDDGRLVRAADRAWDKLKEAGREVRDDLFDAMEEIQGEIKDFKHKRHFLMSEHVHAIKKGDEVQLLYCDTKIKNGIGGLGRLVGVRNNVKQKCEKLHKAASFKVSELLSCVDKVGDDKQGGLVLNDQLQKNAGNGYGYDKLRMRNVPKETYIDYLARCEIALGKKPEHHILDRKPERDVAPPQPAPGPSEPVDEFKPIEEKPGGEAKPFDIPASNL